MSNYPFIVPDAAAGLSSNYETFDFRGRPRIPAYPALDRMKQQALDAQTKEVTNQSHTSVPIYGLQSGIPENVPESGFKLLSAVPLPGHKGSMNVVTNQALASGMASDRNSYYQLQKALQAGDEVSANFYRTQLKIPINTAPNLSYSVMPPILPSLIGPTQNFSTHGTEPSSQNPDGNPPTNPPSNPPQGNPPPGQPNNNGIGWDSGTALEMLHMTDSERDQHLDSLNQPLPPHPHEEKTTTGPSLFEQAQQERFEEKQKAERKKEVKQEQRKSFFNSGAQFAYQEAPAIYSLEKTQNEGFNVDPYAITNLAQTRLAKTMPMVQEDEDLAKTQKDPFIWEGHKNKLNYLLKKKIERRRKAKNIPIQQAESIAYRDELGEDEKEGPPPKEEVSSFLKLFKKAKDKKEEKEEQEGQDQHVINMAALDKILKKQEESFEKLHEYVDENFVAPFLMQSFKSEALDIITIAEENLIEAQEKIIAKPSRAAEAIQALKKGVNASAMKLGQLTKEAGSQMKKQGQIKGGQLLDAAGKKAKQAIQEGIPQLTQMVKEHGPDTAYKSAAIVAAAAMFVPKLLLYAADKLIDGIEAVKANHQRVMNNYKSETETQTQSQEEPMQRSRSRTRATSQTRTKSKSRSKSRAKSQTRAQELAQAEAIAQQAVQPPPKPPKKRKTAGSKADREALAEAERFKNNEKTNFSKFSNFSVGPSDGIKRIKFKGNKMFMDKTEKDYPKKRMKFTPMKGHGVPFPGCYPPPKPSLAKAREDVELGQYLICKKKLRENILSVLRARNRKKTNEYPNQPISDRLKTAILECLVGSNPTMDSLTQEERYFLSSLVKRSKATHLIVPSYNHISNTYQESKDKIRRLPGKELRNQLKINVGELESKNNSDLLKHQTEELLIRLVKETDFSKEIANQIANTYHLNIEFTPYRAIYKDTKNERSWI